MKIHKVCSQKNIYLFQEKTGTDTSFYQRKNLVENWNHINETVLNLGVPEWADVVGGQLFAGGHLR